MCCLLYILTVYCISDVCGSQFDPHVFPSVGPFFEGWYMRIVDFDNQNSYGLLFGHVMPTSSKHSTDPTVLASLLYRANCTMNNQCYLNSVSVVSKAKDLNVTVKNEPVIQNPDDWSPSQFRWKSPFGLFMQYNNITTFQFNFGKYIFDGRIGEPVPWGPNGEGPEGWIDKLPFIPLHWFVFSLRSPLIMYQLLDTETGKTIIGRNGVVHMEKNWGSSFPKGWIWSQGVSFDNVSFALSGGLVSIGPVTTTQYLIGYRNPSKNIILNFRPGNEIISTSHNGCTGFFKVAARGFFHEIHLTASAKLSTFSDCLFGPEVTGFRPACMESYDANVKIVVYERKFLTLNEIDNQLLNFSALEFGGEYTCNKKCRG